MQRATFTVALIMFVPVMMRGVNMDISSSFFLRTPGDARGVRRALARVLVPAWLVVYGVASAQPAGLPELGDTAAVSLSPRVEQRLGEAIMADGRRDPSYIDDPAINQYLTEMGTSLAAHASGAPPQVSIFSIRDSSINAFAMPGGHIGVHSGLVVGAGSESELAGVIAHEIAHVSQRHVARGLAAQEHSSLMMLGSLLAAAAAAAAGAGQLAQGAALFGQAAVVNSQLSFSRSAEREADRIGLQMMQADGYDPAGMSAMFGRLMQTSRFNQGSGPSYASTHPMSIERMSDLQNRTRQLGGRPAREDSDSFWFVRAKLRLLQADNSRVIDPIAALRAEAAEHQGARRAAALYGAAFGLFQRQQYEAARAALDEAVAVGIAHPMLAHLDIELLLTTNDFAAAIKRAEAATARWPQDRALALIQARSLQRAGRDALAIQHLERATQRWPSQEPVMYRMAAESHARLNQAVPEKRNMAEYYVLIGALPAALSQLQQARSATSDFHQQSVLDARISEIQRRIEEDKNILAQFR